jgi:hypothetical protein
MRPVRPALSVLTLACLTALPAAGQDEPETTAPPDPYTAGADAALAARGYVRLGPTTWADRHDARRIEEDLGRVPFRWIETAHFKLGCALPTQRMPRDKDDRQKLGAELELLAETLPNLRPRSVRELDPWLRAHLFAQRLELLYRDFLALTGVDETVFPGPDAPRFRGDAPPEKKWMGRGPYLGVKGKFLVLLCPKASAAGRYLSTHTGAAGDQPSRWYFEGSDNFVFVTAPDFGEGAYVDDRAMHAHLTFNVAHNLIDAYKGYSYLTQAWWKEGLAHRFRRAVSERHNDYSRIVDRGRRAYTTFDWDVKLRQRAEHGLVRPLGAILDQTDCEGFDLIDHAACWSRVCWMIEEHPPEAFATFLDRVQGFVDAQGNPPPAEAQAARQLEALQEAFGADPDALEARWSTWLRKARRGR